MEIGQKAERKIIFTAKMIADFGELTGDLAPVHFDAAVARAMGFKDRIVHGFLISSIYSQLLGCDMPGPSSVIQKLSVDLVAPVYVGQTLHFTVIVSRFSEAVKAVSLNLSAVDESGSLVNRGTAVCIMRD